MSCHWQLYFQNTNEMIQLKDGMFNDLSFFLEKKKSVHISLRRQLDFNV